MKQSKTPQNIFPNQKVIHVHTDMSERSKDAPYGCITIEAITTAIQRLNDGTAAFMLFTRFALNQDDYIFALSPKAIENELHITKRQYDRAVKNLILSGYLVKREGDNYDFYTLPKDTAKYDAEVTNAVGIESPTYEYAERTNAGGMYAYYRDVVTDNYPEVTTIHTDRWGETIQYDTKNNKLNNNIIGEKINEEGKIINQKENNIDSMLKDISEWVSDYKHNQSDTFVSGDEKEYNEVSDENDSKPNISTEFFADIPDVKGDLPF